MAQTVKITPASGLLEFIGNTTTNKPYLQHDDNGNLTLTLQATKKFTVAGNLKVNGKVTMAQQTLTDGAAITWDFNSGANAKVTLAGARTLVISNMEAGDTGLILVKQDVAGSRTLTLPGSSSIVGGGSYTASPAANATDVLGVYYDGTTYWWTIGYNTVTPPLTSVGITGGDFVIANSPLTANGNIGLALATVNSTVGTFGSATAVPVITVNAKGLVTAVSATNISIPTNLDSLTDVTITSAATNQLLQFNGSQWVNWTPNYITSYTEIDTLATVTGRGATTNTAVTFNGNVTLGNNADLIFRDLAGTFPTSGKGFDWELNNDGARIYAIQPGSDSIDLVFQLRDNATTNDRFVFWVDDYQGAAYDKYPLIIRGGTEFDLVSSSLYTNGTLRLSNAGVLQNVTGNISMFTNDSGYITSAPLSGYVPTSRTLSINGTSYDLSANRTWTIDTVSYVSRVQHGVKASTAINKGQAVYVTGADGTNMIVGLASNVSEATSSKTMGLLDATVANNGMANVVTEGLLAGLDTSLAETEGDPVWLGDNGNLIYGLANKPYAPRHLVFIGIVTRKNANNGEIFVKVQNGFELKEIHDVDLITTVPVNGHILGYNGTLWVNKTIAGWLGFTPANDANVVHTTGNETIAGIKTFSGTTQATSTTTGTIITAGGAGIAKNLYVGGDLNVVGNLIIGGTTTTVYAQNLTVSDNMIYLNNGIATTISNAVGNGSSVVYTTQETHNYVIGMSVTITGVSPTAYNLSNQIITGVSTNSFTIANSATGAYSSGGTARAKSNANPDLGFAAGYNDGSYAHAGLFRDATDNTWKFFKGYTPEPDASPFIDTSHASFAYADLQASNITGRAFIKVGGVSTEFLKADGSVDSNTYLTTGSASSAYQPLDGDLTAIAALATTGFLKRTGTNTWTLDSNTYLTSYTETDTLATVTSRGASTTTNITLSGGLLTLSNATSNRINYGTIGVAAPTFTTYSAGTKIVLYDNIAASSVGYTIGIDSGTLFNTVPGADGGLFFKWYGGTTLAASLSGTGVFTAASLVKSGGTASQFLKADGSVDSSSYISAETDTLASVTGRGATTNTASIFRGRLYAQKSQADGDYTTAALWTESYDDTTTGIAFHINGIVGKFLEMRTDQTLYWDNSPVWTAGTLTNLNQLTNGPAYITSAALSGYATQTYVNTAVSNLVASAPSTLDTLNELATALGNDANFSTTITTSIGNKVSKSGDTMTGNLAFGSTSGLGLTWGLNTDAAFIKFISTGNQAGGSYLEIGTQDDSNEEIKFTQSGVLKFYLATDGYLKTGSGYNYVWENGTWAIGISGNAATATNVAWTGVTSRPTALSQFSNDLGNYGGWLTQAAANPLYVNVTGDTMTGPLVITGTTSGQELFAVNGVNGRLFTVSDDLSNSLFSVNTVAGLPVIEAFANNTVNIGPFSAPIVINASGISTPSHGTSANWNSAYNDTITSAAVSGTTSKTLTLTQRDGGTVTATWTDIDTDTDQQTLSVNGSTLSISGGNSITLPTGGISQATADGLYAAISHSHTFASLTSKPTTISGYGITDAITTGNIGSQSVNYATYAAYVENDAYYMRFHWNGQNGQPTWLWGGNDGENMYIYDPSNFSVNYANSAGVLSSMNISQFTNNSGYLTAESDTLATVTGRGATTTTPIIVTASEGREVAVYMPSSYTTDDLVSGHEYGWYADHWRLGMTRSGGAQGADFVVQWNAARRLSLTNGGNLTVTGTISATNFSGTHSGSSSGTNTGDQTNISGNAATATALTSMNISQFTNNSGYITSYSETDTLYSVTNRGNTTIQDIEFTNGRKGLVGRYDATQTQAIFAMGAQYVLQDGAASGQIGNLYGLAWSYNPDYGGAGNNPQSKAGLNHQLLLMQNGITTAAMGSGIWTSGNITAANFSGSSSGTNTGDQTNISGNAATAGTATYASILSTTNQGIVGPTGLTTVSSTTQWSNYPIGYSAMFLQGQTATGTPSSNYGYFIKLANRDGGGGWGGIWSDYSGGDTYVGNTTVSSSYANWYKLLSSTNYNSYSPTLTGTGASGTWSINITGTAGTAGSLTSMNISQFTNNSGYLTGITSGNVTTALGYTPWHAGNDGAGSGLDADLLDGYTSDTAANVNTIVRRDASGNIYSNYVLGSYFNASAGNSANPAIGQIWTQDTSDNYLRKSTPAHFRSQIIDGYYLPLGGGTITGTVNFSNNNLDGVGHITMSDSGFGEGIQWESWFICDSPNDNTNQTGNLQFVYVPDNNVRMTFDTDGTLTLSNRLVELSSIRYKTNVESLTPALDKVLQLRPVYYTKISGTGSTEIGLIAEEVAEIYPELIKYNDAGQVDGINYTRIAPILIKTIQEQQELIKKLTERIENLENR